MSYERHNLNVKLDLGEWLGLSYIKLLRPLYIQRNEPTFVDIAMGTVNWRNSEGNQKVTAKSETHLQVLSEVFAGVAKLLDLNQMFWMSSLEINQIKPKAITEINYCIGPSSDRSFCPSGFNAFSWTSEQ